MEAPISANLLAGRRAALEMLLASHKGGMTTQLEARILAELGEQDKKFAGALFKATVKHLGELDRVIGQFMKQPFPEKSVEAAILRLGLAQLLLMGGVKPHAAVSATVELAKSQGFFRAAPVINGVLRNTLRNNIKINKEELKLPGWFKNLLQKDYSSGVFHDLVAGLGEPASLDLYTRPTLKKTASLEKLATPLPTGGWRVTDKTISPKQIPGWEEGLVYIQDAAAQLPARLLASGLTDTGPVLDLCAAPGGKTLQLFDLLPEYHVLALDSSRQRLKLMAENFHRCQVTVPVAQGDGLALPFPQGAFAGVLLDAPCSATGTLRRNPDILLHRKESTIGHLAMTQARFLRETARVMAPGGVLVYAVCSLLKREGETQIASFLKKHKNFKRLPIKAEEVGGRGELLTPEGDLRTLPQHGMDGFFAARLVRTD